MEYLLSGRRGTEFGRIPIRSPGWTTPARGVRVPGDVNMSHELRTTGALAVSSRTAVACDLTAAQLWGMVLPSGFGMEIDAQACAIATHRDGSRHRAAGIRGRRLTLPSAHLVRRGAWLLTTPARTWLDCAALITWPDLVAMGDDLLRKGVTERRELERMVTWGRGRRGVRPAREALGILDPASESPGESWLRAYLIRAGLPRPVCNLPVHVSGFAFRLDLAWPTVMVAVEYDGVDHHSDEHQAKDNWRRALLRQAGWTIIVVHKNDLRERVDIISLVTRALSQRDRVPGA
jgi:hypothetical protein